VNRSRRTRILVEGSEELRARLSDDVIEHHEVHEVEGPTETLVMLTVRETARGHLFHPGELLVTEARARIGQTIGLGIAAGSCARKAWQLAVIDAACNARLPRTERWDVLLLQEEGRLQRERERNEGRILQTRVAFETMDLT
jgi:alpha-D-ribose 1-methylphosphonate 5-triphosphate synthase subunit PhnG